MRINNRRYIGCKTKLISSISDVVKEYGFDSKYSFADIFAGTGVVANYFADNGYKVLLNDTLYSNYVAYQSWLGQGTIDEEKIKLIIDGFNLLKYEDIAENYLSNIYGNKYFSVNDAKKIGFIRQEIENKKSTLTSREYFYLITSLLYASDKIANTVGHFESFLNKETKDKNIKMELLEINKDIIPAEIFNMDANELAKKILYDIVYIDPPYNARQYINFYHVLENIARWNKPTEFQGNSMKFKRDELKSNYCRNEAPKLLKDLVDKLKCKLIIVSYNNTYSAKSTSSNNKISEEQLLTILKNKGTVQVKEISYSYFNAGKTNFNNHKELLYICKVER